MAKPNLDNLIKFMNLVRGGKIFSVTFIKRTTGQKRKMVARLGVRKYVSGAGRKFNPTMKNLVSVFDMQKGAYRFVACENLLEVKANGQTYKF